MFNVSTIQSGLYGVVGFRQPLNPDYAILDANNTTSRSGEYVTNNPYCKIEYLYDNQDYRTLSDADFNTVIENMQKESIAFVCHQIFNKPDYIDRQVLYPYPQNKVATEALPDGFVCFKIEVANDKNIAFEIKRIMLDFEGAGDLEILLFNTSQSTPIQSQTVTVSSSHQVLDLNWVIDNSGDTYKGDYYLGYLTNYASIGTLKPYKREYENSDIMATITHLCVDTYYFAGINTNVLPNLDNERTTDQCIGLNPDITVFEDFTDLILRNERLLAHAINLDLQVKCIESYLASLRSNENERNADRQIQLLLSQIEGTNSDSAIVVTGLRTQLSRAITHVQREINKLRSGYLDNRLYVTTLE